MKKEDFIAKFKKEQLQSINANRASLENQNERLITGKMNAIIDDALMNDVELTNKEILELAKESIKVEFENYISIAQEFYSKEWIKKRNAEETAKLEQLNGKKENMNGKK